MAKGKRKQVKAKRVETVEDEELKLQDKIFVVFCIVMFFVAFYVLTLYITHKNSDSSTTETSTEATISYQEILLGRSLSMDEKEYLVIYYDSSNADVSSSCSELVTNYRNNHDTTLYYVDMNNTFNKAYATEEESNKSPKSAKELKINGPTVIKVSDKKVVDYIEGLDEVNNYLQ